MELSEKTRRISGFALFALCAAGLVLVIVGMCLKCFVRVDSIVGGTAAETNAFGMFGDEWKSIRDMGVTSNAPLIVAFILTLLGLATLAVDGVLRLFFCRGFSLVRIVGFIFALVGTVTVLIAALVIVNALNEKAGGTFLGVSTSFSTQAGVWLGFAGGLVGTIGGALPILKAFDVVKD